MSVISLSSGDEDDCIILESENEQEVLEDSFKVFVADNEPVPLEPIQSPSSEIYIDGQSPDCEDLDPLAEVDILPVKESSTCNNDEMPTSSKSNSLMEYESILPDDSNYLTESENVGVTLNPSTRIEEPPLSVNPISVTVETLQNNTFSNIPNNCSDNLKYIAERLAEVLACPETSKRKQDLTDAEATILEVSREKFSTLQYENRWHGKHIEKNTTYARATSEKKTRKRKQGLTKNTKLITDSFEDLGSSVNFLEKAQNQKITNEEVIMNHKKRRGRRKKVGQEKSLKPKPTEGPINNASTLHYKPKKQYNPKHKKNSNHSTTNQTLLNHENQINNLDEGNNKLRFTFDRHNSTVSVSFVTNTTQNHKSDSELQSHMHFDELEAISKLENNLLLAQVGSEHSSTLISKIANFRLIDLSQLKVGFVQIYKQIFDEPAEALCKNMGDLLLIVMKEFRTYQTRKESAKRLTCEQLKNDEIKIASSYYNSTVKKYAKAFERYFDQMWLKILHTKICIEQCKAVLLALFLKIFLYVSTIATEFSSNINEAKDNVKDLLAHYFCRSVLVKMVFWANATDFERDCWIVLDLMQDCLDDTIDEQSIQESTGCEQSIATVISNRPTNTQVNNMLCPTTTKENHCSDNIDGKEMVNHNTPELQQECLTETTTMPIKNNSLNVQVDTLDQPRGKASESIAPALQSNLISNTVSVIKKSGPTKTNKPGTCNDYVSTSESDTAAVGITTDSKEPTLTKQTNCLTTPNISVNFEEITEKMIRKHLVRLIPRNSGPVNIRKTASISSAIGSTTPEMSISGKSTEENSQTSQQYSIKRSVYSNEPQKQESKLLDLLRNPFPNPNVSSPFKQQLQPVTTCLKSQLLDRSYPAVPAPSTTQSTLQQHFDHTHDQYQPSQTSSFNDLPNYFLHPMHSSHGSNTKVANNQFSSNNQIDFTSTSGFAAPERPAQTLHYDNRSQFQSKQPLMKYGQLHKNAATHPYHRPQATSTHPYTMPTTYSYQTDMPRQYSYINSNMPYSYNQPSPQTYNTNKYMKPPPLYPYHQDHYRGPVYQGQECFGGKRDVRTFVNSSQKVSPQNTQDINVYMNKPNNPIHMDANVQKDAGVTINNFNITAVLPPVSTILPGPYTASNNLYSAAKGNADYGHYPSSVPQERFSYPEAGGPQQTHHHNSYTN